MGAAVSRPFRWDPQNPPVSLPAPSPHPTDQILFDRVFAAKRLGDNEGRRAKSDKRRAAIGRNERR